jgi:autotransporter-associated beta strand protein
MKKLLAKPMKKLLASCILFFSSVFVAAAQDSYTGTNSTGNWFSARWNNAADAAPYTSVFTVGNNAIFPAGNYTFTGMGSASNVGNITLLDNVNVTFTLIGSSLATGGNVRTITVGAGSVLDLSGQVYSTTAGTGFIKAGAGVFATGGGTYQGGTTINAGTVIVRGVTGLGSGATNSLTLYGGVIAANATRSFDNTRFGGGIVIGGNVQFGELSDNVALANSTANFSFANNVSLGSANRTLTLGNQGTQTFSGIISNTGSGGVTFAANAGTTGGRFALTGTANTFTGDISINGGEARFSADGSLGNGANDIIIDGGTFSMATNTTNTISSVRDIFVGDGAGTQINAMGATGRIIYDGVIADKSGETGSFTHGGLGTLQLGGANTYTGRTTISAGTVALSGTGSIGTGGLNLGTTGSPGAFDLSALTAGTYSLPATGNLAGVGTLSGSGKSLAVLGSLAPGNSAGTITVGTGLSLDLSNSGSSVFEITSPAFTAGTFDLVNGDGSVVFGGILNLAFSGGTYADGTDVLQLFANTGGRSGNFSAVNATGLAPGQSATFNSATGTITVVPEPSTYAMALAGLACGGYSMLRRRKKQA